MDWPQRARKPEQLLRALRVLVVGGNLEHQQRARKLLSAQGAHVRLAIGWRRSVREVSADSPWYDVIMVDAQTDRLYGYAVTRLIRERVGLTTPVIGMVPVSAARNRAFFSDVGMTDLVGTPLDETELVATILMYVQRHSWRNASSGEPASLLDSGAADPTSASGDSPDRPAIPLSRRNAGFLMETTSTEEQAHASAGGTEVLAPACHGPEPRGSTRAPRRASAQGRRLRGMDLLPAGVEKKAREPART
jgi:DNA-binding response OmpR family regulator